jgi:putative spermidine/putrescine transport system substrate-binding protein
MDQLFATGELNITYGFAEAGVEDNVLQGLFPKSTKVYAWKNGTVKNSNYLGISYNARNKAGAMAVINFLISPEAQLERMTRKEMRGNTVLSMEKLPEEWQRKFEAAPERKYGASLEELEDYAIKEPKPDYMINVYEEFRTEVIEK